MTARIVLAAACVCAITAGSAHAQQPFHDQEATEAFHHYQEATEAFHAAIAQAKPQLLPPAPIQPNAPATPRQPVPPPAPALKLAPSTGQSVNVNVEFVITDKRAGLPGVRKSVSVTVADGNQGSIRSSSFAGLETRSFPFQYGGEAPLNIDTTPTLQSDGKIRLQFTVQYDMPAPADTAAAASQTQHGPVAKTTLRSSMTVILESGKSMLASQSADPIEDRQVTVEVKATVLR